MKGNETIKDQMQKLEEVIAWFESDDFVLEDAVAKFKEAERIAEGIRQKLETIKGDITVLSQTFNEDGA